MAESLREQQRRLARLRIIEAAAALIAADGPASLSMASVADTAAVSVRTVYNYFDNADLLVAAVATEARERLIRLGAVEPEPDLDRFPDLIRHNARLHEALGEFSVAMARIDAGTRAGRRRSRRSDLMSTLAHAIADTRPDLDDHQVDALANTMRVIVFSGVVGTMGTPSRSTRDGTVESWAFETLTEALRNGRGPYDER